MKYTHTGARPSESDGEAGAHLRQPQDTGVDCPQGLTTLARGGLVSQTDLDTSATTQGRRCPFRRPKMDFVIDKGRKSAILTMTERKTNIFLQSKLTSRKPDVAAMAAWWSMLPYKYYVHHRQWYRVHEP